MYIVYISTNFRLQSEVRVSTVIIIILKLVPLPLVKIIILSTNFYHIYICHIISFAKFSIYLLLFVSTAINLTGVTIFTVGAVFVAIILYLYVDTLRYIIKNAPPMVKTHSAFILSVYPVSGNLFLHGFESMSARTVH